jgi:type II secretory pathway pseudopilin PulG
MLMVIVTIGILVTVLIPRWAAARDKASVAAMTSDLRNLATAQEAYFDEYSAYSPSTTDLSLYSPSSGTTVRLAEAGAGGWSASASSTWTLRHCYVFYGNAVPVGPAHEEGVIACD